MRDKCRELPAGSPPNSELFVPYLDQSGSNGVYGGVMVYSAKEAADLTKADTPKFGLISLRPQKAGAYVVVTEELLANAAAAAGFLPPLFRGAQSSWIDDKIGTGNGAGELLGFRDCDAVIEIDRSVDDHINYIDLVNMYVRTLGRGNYVWLCSKVNVLAELMTLTDGSGNLIWTTSAREGQPNTLLSLPVFYDELGPTLGSAGDLMLVDLNYYLLKPGMAPTFKSDQGFSNFLGDKITMKMSFWIDGQPWLRSPLTLRDGSNTVSPFIKLAA
jgi:HK97 family phage major capsid protein